MTYANDNQAFLLLYNTSATRSPQPGNVLTERKPQQERDRQRVREREGRRHVS